MKHTDPSKSKFASVDEFHFPDAYSVPTPDNAGVLITGAAKRLGRAFAIDLAQAGWPVAIHYNGSATAAREVRDFIKQSGGRAEIVQADLSDGHAVNDLVEQAESLIGPIGVLINNASVFEWDDTPSANDASFGLHMDVHLKSPLTLSQKMIERLNPKAGGVIVNVIDSRVLNPKPRHLTYTLSKSGLWTMTRMMAEELAPRVRVNAIGPGPILPPAGQTEAQFRDRCARLPLQRPASLAEACDAVRFLISQRAVTGQMIALDGGDHFIGQ